MIFIISIIIAIGLHELGHLFVAKKLGCSVLKYSIGFGKAIWSKTINGTTYQITPFLLGGFVTLEGETEISTNPKAFSNLPYHKKVLIAIAGCLVNIITGQICMSIALHYILATWGLGLYYFGAISLTLGLFNLVPFPALDGALPILVWAEKIYGKAKGYKIINKLSKIGFIIIMTLNIICLPWLIMLLIQGKL